MLSSVEKLGATFRYSTAITDSFVALLKLALTKCRLVSNEWLNFKILEGADQFSSRSSHEKSLQAD